MNSLNLHSNIVNGFNKYYDSDNKYLIHQGGTSSGKTYNNLIYFIEKLFVEQNILITVVSESVPHLMGGAFKDFNEILNRNNLNNYFNYTGYRRTFTNKKTNSRIEFMSFDTEDKAKGGRRDYLFINEAFAISYNIALQLIIRTNQNIVIDYNPVSNFWVHSHLLIKENAKLLVTNYQNNRFLSKSIIDEIEAQKSNENWFRVYGMGLVGNVENIVFPNIVLIDSLPNKFNKIKAIDLGYTNDPTVVLDMEVDFKTKNIYIDELLFKTFQTPSDIEKVFIQNKFIKQITEIVTDTNEPRLISGFYQNGWNVHNAVKNDKMLQVTEMRNFTINITKRSTNTIKEFRNLLFKKDREGNSINDILKKDDHAVDAARYGFWRLYKAMNMQPVHNTSTNIRPAERAY